MGLCASNVVMDENDESKHKRSMSFVPSMVARTNADEQDAEIEEVDVNDDIVALKAAYKTWQDKDAGDRKGKKDKKAKRDAATEEKENKDKGMAEAKKRRPRPRGLSGTLEKKLHDTLGSNQLRKTVQLPIGEDLNEWLAVNVTHFTMTTEFVVEMAEAHCTSKSCPVMRAGKKYEYMWRDSNKYKSPTAVSARHYNELVFSWCHDKLNDNRYFPENGAFPKDFRPVVGRIMKRLFRSFAHIYYHHFAELKEEKKTAHLNTCFKEFELLDSAEMAPMRKVIAKW